MFNAIMLSADIGSWLLEQAPVIVLMGVVIWWLAKRLIKSEGDKDDLAKDVIKLTTLWEEKNGAMDDSSDKDREKILELLRDIKMLVKKEP
jgi:hypothetical protein